MNHVWAITAYFSLFLSAIGCFGRIVRRLGRSGAGNREPFPRQRSSSRPNIMRCLPNGILETEIERLKRKNERILWLTYRRIRKIAPNLGGTSLWICV